MKKILLLILCLSVIGNIFCQSNKKNYFGVNASFGDINYKRYRSTTYTSSEFEGKTYFCLGFDYEQRIYENVDFCTGFVFTKNSLINHWTNGSYSGSNMDELFIFSFPFHIKYHFLNYLFVDGGVCVNYHPSQGYTWGVGLGAGVGAEYVFNNGFAVSLSPNMQLNFLTVEKHDSKKDRYDNLTRMGIKFGLGYRF